MPYVHPFELFLAPRDTSRRLSAFHTRDLSAAWEIAAVLQERGYFLGSQKLNFPPPAAAERALLEIDCSDIRGDDIVLTVTRPPLHDEQQGDRRRVPRGYTTLERVTDEVWRRYFEILSRSHAKLAPCLYPCLPQGYESRRDMFFMQSGTPDYKMLDSCNGSRRIELAREGRTAAFLLIQPELWKRGPTFVGLFGMSGESTLAWAYLLRHRYSALLERPGFHMAELQMAPIAERVPDHRWALDWRAELLFSAPPQDSPAAQPILGPKRISGRAQSVPPAA